MECLGSLLEPVTGYEYLNLHKKAPVRVLFLFQINQDYCLAIINIKMAKKASFMLISLTKETLVRI